jgi:hypothetical protein
MKRKAAESQGQGMFSFVDDTPAIAKKKPKVISSSSLTAPPPVLQHDSMPTLYQPPNSEPLHQNLNHSIPTLHPLMPMPVPDNSGVSNDAESALIGTLAGYDASPYDLPKPPSPYDPFALPSFASASATTLSTVHCGGGNVNGCNTNGRGTPSAHANRHAGFSPSLAYYDGQPSTMTMTTPAPPTLPLLSMFPLDPALGF